MSNSLSEFGATAGKLARNPLGIIALFIVLLYGIAGLVLGTTAEHFQPDEREPLIWFLVGFPVLVLGVFSWLVSSHHTKLYSPGDYKTDEAFLKTLSPEAQKLRLDKEVAELESAEEAETLLLPESTDSLEAPSAQPEGATDAREEVAVSRFSALHEFRAQAVIAEDLVFRQIASEFSHPIQRQVAIVVGGKQIHLDGVIDIPNETIGVEVKLFKGDSLRKNLTNRLNDIAGIAARFGSLGLVGSRMIIAVVGTGLDHEAETLVKSRFDEIVHGVNTPVELRLYDLDQLKNRFGIPTDA